MPMQHTVMVLVDLTKCVKRELPPLPKVSVGIDMCIDMHIHMCADTCINMCTDM